MTRAILLAIPMVLVARASWAQDPFEIQVYDSETAPPLEPGMEIHTNYVARGATVGGPGPVLPNNQVVHLTFEPHLGLNEWSELGGYLQTAFQPDRGYEFGGVKLRFKARVPQRLTGRFGLALNAEVSGIPTAFSESRFGSELRPVVDLKVEHAYFSINPIVDIDFGGSLAGRPQLEPAAKAEWMLNGDQLGLGFEYYSALGPISAPLGPSQVHRLFGVLDLVDLPLGPTRLGVNFGVGYGIAGDEKWIVKSIVGVAVP
jgi:hypothetical protein